MFLLCEVHLWSEHQAVMAGQPFCGWMSQTPPPPTEGLQRPFGPNTVCTYGIQFGPMLKEETKVGGLRTAVATALLLVLVLHGPPQKT